MIRKGSRISITETNYFYLIVGLALLFIGSYVQSREIYTGLIITEYLIIMLPTISYIKLRGNSVKRVLRLNKLSFKQGILIPFIVVLAYPVGMFVNLIMVIILSSFGKVIDNPVPIPETNGELMLGLVVIALSAGICEEIMFRGLVMNSYEKLGKWKGIIISGILFGFFHFNIQNLLGPIFLGILFGYIVYKTNSIFAGIIAHTTNNALALFLGYLITKLGVDTQATSEAAELAQSIPQTTTLLIGAAVIGIFAVITGLGAFGLLWVLPKSKEVNYDKSVIEVEEPKNNVFVSILPLILCGIIFVILTYRILASI